MRGMKGAMKMARRDAYRNSSKRYQQYYQNSNITPDASGCSEIFVIGILLFFVVVITSCS